MRSNTFLNLLPSPLLNRTLFHPQHTLVVVDGLSCIQFSRLRRILPAQKHLKMVFLGGVDTFLSVLDVVSSPGGNQPSSNEFSKSYSDYSLSQSLPRNSNLLTWRYERRYLTFQMQTKLRVFFLPRNPDACVPLLPTEDYLSQISALEFISKNSTVFQQTILVRGEYFLMHVICRSSNSLHLPLKF